MQLTRPNSLILQLFTQEEIDTICLLASYAFNIPHKVTPKQLIALASRSFSMIIISDSTTADWGRVEFANAIRHSVSEQLINAFITGTADTVNYKPLYMMARVNIYR